MFTNITCTKDEMKLDECLKEELLNTIREEIDLGFEDWKPELKKFIKKTIKKSIKRAVKKYSK